MSFMAAINSAHIASSHIQEAKKEAVTLMMSLKNGLKKRSRLKEMMSIDERQPYVLSKIDTNDNDVVLTWNGEELHIQTNEDGTLFQCFDSSGSLLPLVLSDDKTTLSIN